MELKKLYSVFKQTTGVATDTRKIHKNSFYFALKGENFDGNLFAKEALEKGASFCLVDNPLYQSKHIFYVENVLDTLQRLAQFHRKQLNIPIIAITGSNGKTTSKDLIYNVLCYKYKVVATRGNLNNHIGVPLTLLSMNEDTQIGIVEMGANHQGEIAKLSEYALPDFGYITNFGQAHLEGFGGFQGVIKGKTELYSYLRTSNGKAFVNQNDILQLEHSQNIERIVFGKDFKIKDDKHFIKVKYRDIIFESNLMGNYNFDNIIAAVSMGMYFQVPLEDIQKAIKNYVPKDNRSQIIEKSYYTFILDAYNANPTSVKLALENFKSMKIQNKIIILGDMFELGKYSVQEHQNIVNITRKIKARTYFIGKNYERTSAKEPQKFKTFGAFKEYLKNRPFKKESVILIKGSRIMALERILDLV